MNRNDRIAIAIGYQLGVREVEVDCEQRMTSRIPSSNSLPWLILVDNPFIPLVQCLSDLCLLDPRRQAKPPRIHTPLAEDSWTTSIVYAPQSNKLAFVKPWR